MTEQESLIDDSSDVGLTTETVRPARAGGRPRLEAPKQVINFRLAADLIEGIRATGKGYNARVETVLREALAAGRLDALRDLLGSQNDDVELPRYAPCRRA